MKRLTFWILLGSVAVLVGIGWVSYEAGYTDGALRVYAEDDALINRWYGDLMQLHRENDSLKAVIDSLSQKEGGK